MKKIKITSSTQSKIRKTLVQFIVKYGDGHITRKAVNWINRTPFSKIDKNNGDAIHVFLNEKNQIIGIIAISHYGLEQAIIVIHPNYRKKGLGNQMTKGVLEDIDKYYVRVATDNIASLKLCFSSGMRAFHLVKGPTGKPTLVLGMGNWEITEWLQYQIAK